MVMPTNEELSRFSNDMIEEENRVFGLHWIVLAGPVVGCAATFVILFIAVSVFFSIEADASEEVRALVSFGAVGMFLLTALSVVRAMTLMATTRLTIYADRVVWTTGCFSRVNLTSLVRQVVGCDYGQTWIERLLGCGTVRIDTKGVDTIVARQIDKAPDAAKIILYLQRNEERAQ